MYKLDVASTNLIEFLSNMDNNRMLFTTHASSLSMSSLAYHRPSHNFQHAFHLQNSINILKSIYIYIYIYIHTLHIFNYEFQLVQLLNFVVIERLTFKFHPYQREIQWNLNFTVKNNKQGANAISFKFYIVSIQKNILHSL